MPQRCSYCEKTEKQHGGKPCVDVAGFQRAMGSAAMAGKVLQMPGKITAFVCPPPCEHVMDGPLVAIDDEGRTTSRTCSKCGMAAIDVSMMRDE